MKFDKYPILFFLLITTTYSYGTNFKKVKNEKEKNPIDYVDAFIGTGGVSNNNPHAVYPFGMVQLGPNTGETLPGGYNYSDKTIIGFVHTQISGAGCGDYSDLIFMPTTGKLQLEPGSPDDPASGYRSAFSHKDEISKPGYYSVKLLDHDIKVELTV